MTHLFHTWKFVPLKLPHGRRQWHPTQVLLPGESQGRQGLVGCRLWGRTESDRTEAMQQQQQAPPSISLLTSHFWHPPACYPYLEAHFWLVIFNNSFCILDSTHKGILGYLSFAYFTCRNTL